jgi:hypothetical protein
MYILNEEDDDEKMKKNPSMGREDTRSLAWL